MPVVQKTWAPEAGRSIVYYSEEESEEYSTVDIGVANTERGVCVGGGGGGNAGGRGVCVRGIIL